MISCPYCDIKGALDDSRQFDPLGTPLGGDPIYGCRNCKTPLLLVPGRLRQRFHILLADGWEAASMALPQNQPEDGTPRMLTDAGRRAMRDLPMSTPKREYASDNPDD
jgi:hypothetical protein